MKSSTFQEIMIDCMFCLTCNKKYRQRCQHCGYSLQTQAASLLMDMKREAKTEYFKSSSNHCMITSLNDSLLMVVASYLDPPDVYRLAQTSKQFHKPSTELSTRHFLSPPQLKPVEYLQNNTVTNLASRLLQQSLIHGLTSVLQAVNTNVSINELRRIVKFQEDELSMDRKVLLSGSVAVQIATGKRFKEFDLDFFCNRQSAPGFRQLMRDLGYCCESVLPHYNDHADQYNLRDIHHVETFIPSSDVETVAISTLVGEYYRAWNAQLAAVEADDEVPPELEHIDMSVLNYRNLCLHMMQRNSRYRFPRDYPVALTTPNNFFAGSDDANISSKNGSIQLVVCRTCPILAINQFDMDICKSSFDGRRLNIVSMNDTFNFRTKSDHHMKFINCYVPCFLLSGDRSVDTCCCHDAACKTCIRSVTHVLSDTETSDDMIIHIMQCVVDTVKSVDRLTQLAVVGTDNFKLLYSGSNLDYTPKYFLALHNKLVRLLQRALKYLHRGIDVPLSENVKVLLGCSIHQYDQDQDMFARPSKRARLLCENTVDMVGFNGENL